jgi:uncharacterized protein (DUF302 family)
VDHPSYGLTRDLPGVPFEDALDRTVEALKTEGFGVLTRIDVDQVMKAKLGADLPRYVILGACNPPLAHQALTADPWVGLLLPCNVVVTQDGDGSVVSAVRPGAMFSVVQVAGVASVVEQVEQKLKNVLERI